ncbi:MAG: ATP-binding protein, partial [Nitrospirota bacterium]|nr:ATP-binding protein [Nitrospirota bacterium]
EQFNKQQLLLSGSIAESIKAHIYFLEKNVLHFADLLSKAEMGGRSDFNWLIRDANIRQETVETTFGILDPRGSVILYKGDGDKEQIRTAASEIISLAKKTASGSAAALETKNAVYVLAPVYYQDVLRYVVFESMGIKDIADYFVSRIKLGARGYAWMMNKNGTLIYHPAQPEMVGGNVYKASSECFKCHISFDLEKKIIEGKASVYGRHIAATGEDKILAFSSVDIGNISWIIAISSPYSEVTQATRQSMKLYSYLIISIFITTSFVSALLIVFNKRRIKAEEVSKRKEELERYAAELEERVTERTAELAGEKEKLKTVVNAIGGGIMLIDREGTIKWSNEKVKEMTGFDVDGKSCDDICPNCSVVFGKDKQDNISATIMSNLFGQKDRYYQVTNAPVKGDNNELHGHIRLIQDVTEMKKMEEQIIHSEKLASIGRLAAGIAHEIGNPLTSIFSFIQILREMEDDKFKKESLQTIYFHINRISEILKQLSGFSRMPAGEASECRINDIIETSINLIQYDKKAKNVSIVKELSPSLPEVVCSGNQLSQVFVNLILNAIDAMPDGGALTIKSMTRGSDIVIRFEDTGVGIPKEDLTRIFDPFYTTKEKGTGLGLAVSYDIIKKMNGALSIESELGKGSVFTITMPCSS